MTRRKSTTILSVMFGLLLLGLLAPPVSALDGVEVLDSAGLVEREVWGAPSPTPDFCYWELGENAGPEYHATNVDGYGNTGCTFPWLAHCDEDSLVFHGTWPPIEGPLVLGADFRALLSVEINFSTAARLSTERIVDGNLDVDEHTLNIVFPDGTHVTLLGVLSDPINTLDIEPGTYLVTLEVNVSQNGPTGTPVDPYDGWVGLKWEDPELAVTNTSWSSLKALYR